MLSIAEMQRWATVVRDYAATAVVLLAASIITAAFALARRRAAARRWRRHTGGYSPARHFHPSSSAAALNEPE